MGRNTKRYEEDQLDEKRGKHALQKKMDRSRAPVFVLGCHRSGTNLLYDMLMSAGGFARYADDLSVHHTLIPRFGDLSRLGNRRRLMETWLRSKAFRRSGLEAKEISAKILERCNSGGEFYQIVMGEIARSQGAQRWAGYDPDNAFYIPRLHEEVPEALFVHIIRDGRDVAFGLSKKDWIPCLPWDSSRRILVMGAFWQWMLTKGRMNGRRAVGNYIEVRFEDLILHPQETLTRLGSFLEHDLNYERIVRSAVGVVARPNSSHQFESGAGGFSPAQRWKQQLSRDDVDSFEALYGDLLEDLGYETTSNGNRSSAPALARLVGVLYPLYFESKLQMKSRTPLGRFASLAHLEIQRKT